jgi:tRNA 2-selenouridine synthase
MTHRADTDDFLSLFLNDIPLMDVRAPVEFNKGAFPHADNRPLLDDQQRELIGTRYTEAGEDEAIQLGLELATPEIRQQRLQHWREFCQQHPAGYLYCFRGGLRSHTTQQWLKEQGVDYPLIKGGYKAMRRFLLDQFEQNIHNIPLILLAGPTGSGKTRVLHQLRYFVDFEGLANHRGSAFGRTLDAQPSQIDWENAVSIEFLKHLHRRPKGAPLIIEDEARLIGRIYLPDELQAVMKESNLVVLERDMDSRVELIQQDYIDQQWPVYQQQFGDQALSEFSDFVLKNLHRIRKRLGGVRYQQVQSLFKLGLEQLDRGEITEGFQQGIRQLLEEYYDPMYQYQLDQRQGRVLFSGDEQALIEWTNEYLVKPEHSTPNKRSTSF